MDFRDNNPILSKHLVHDLQNAVIHCLFRKKYRDRSQSNPGGETCPPRICMCVSSVSIHSTVSDSKAPLMLFTLPKRVQMRYNFNLKPKTCLLLEFKIYIQIIKL